MAEGEGCIELKFRIYDGTDIAHSTYSSSTTVGTLKQKLVAEWPQGLSSCGVCLYKKFLKTSQPLWFTKNIFGNNLVIQNICGNKLVPQRLKWH